MSIPGPQTTPLLKVFRNLLLHRLHPHRHYETLKKFNAYYNGEELMSLLPQRKGGHARLHHLCLNFIKIA